MSLLIIQKISMLNDETKELEEYKNKLIGEIKITFVKDNYYEAKSIIESVTNNITRLNAQINSLKSELEKLV